MELTSNTSRSRLSQLSIPPRGSVRTRRDLQRLANICTPRSVSVTVEFDETDAHCRPDEGRDGEAYVITIPTEKIDQVRTDLPARVWDKRVQVALLFHELGHALYSDFDRFESVQSQLAPEWHEPFRTVYNAAEDGVIETQVAREFDTREDFIVLNDTFAGLAERTRRGRAALFDEGDVAIRHTVLEAIAIGLLDNGFGNSGRFEAILDPGDRSRIVKNGHRDIVESIRPRLETYMADMLSESDGSERVDLALEFFEDIRPDLDPLPTVQLDRLDSGSPRPVDLVEDTVGDPDTATHLPDSDAARAHVVAVETAAAIDGQSPPGRLRTADVSEAAAEMTVAGDTARAGETRSAMEREATRLLELVTSNEDLDRAMVTDPDRGDGDRARWTRAAQRSERLRRALDAQLRRRRRTRRQRGHRSGSLDGRRVTQIAQGNDRVFTRRERGDDRDYTCLVVLDRSGSMQGRMEAAENATAQLVTALYEVGVDVSVLSIYEGCPWLELPFGGAPRDHVDHLLTGRTSGGTPLSDALAIARHRVPKGDGEVPLVFVVSDGAPNNEQAYIAELDRCTFPVFGVYVVDDPEQAIDSGHSDFFDRMVAAEPDGVSQALTELTRTLFKQ